MSHRVGVTPQAARVWQTIHEHGPMSATQAHEAMGDGAPATVKATHECVAQLHRAGSLEVAAWSKTRGANARVYRATVEPVVREPVLQRQILELLGDLGPMPIAKLHPALRAKGVRPNAQKLGSALRALRLSGRLEISDGRESIYRIATGESTEPARVPARISERHRPVGPSGRRLSEADEDDLDERGRVSW